MLSRRKTYAGRIKHPDDATEPATLDPLGSMAPLFRARPEIQDVCRFALQWEVVHEAEPAGVCPPATCRAIRSRPDGVRRALLMDVIRSAPEKTKASTTSASPVRTGW